MVMGLSRMDLMEKKGLKIPQTFAELQEVSAAINGTDNVSGIVSFQLHHWNLPPYMQGFGVPGMLLPAVIALQLGGGVLIAAGAMTRPVALALSAFCVLTAVIFHWNVAVHGELLHFEKSLFVHDLPQENVVGFSR